MSLYRSWRPWLSVLGPFSPLADPTHVTLFCDRNSDLIYQDAISRRLSGTWLGILFIIFAIFFLFFIIIFFFFPGLFVGPEGVAVHIVLPAEQRQWYMISDLAESHVMLAINGKHQVKDLGPMTKV